MQAFFKIFQNLGTTILFLFLELISLFLIIRYNKAQNEIFLHSSNEIASNWIRQKSRIEQSFDLVDQNDQLLAQNAKLIEELVNQKTQSFNDSTYVEKKFQVIPAKVINNTIHTMNNYLTLDLGLKDTIQKSMGVLANNGPVGVINQVSEKYSTAISLLNVNLRISASISEKDYAGYLSWSGMDYNRFKLNGIPKHADISIGDLIITSGHSSIFPKGIEIGTIESYDIIEGGAFYNISVNISQDLTTLNLVYLIKNKDFEEIKALESLNED